MRINFIPFGDLPDNRHKYIADVRPSDLLDHMDAFDKFKLYFMEKFPTGGVVKHNDRYFIIKFTDEAEEAEFIMREANE